jgi:tripartite-type tricarboxylate transporter receptor subunit TctC
MKLLKKNCQSAGACFALSLIVASIFPSSRDAQGAEQFYSGKTIQMIVSSGPGVATDIAARLVARYLGKHVPGNPAIITRNMPGGGGLVSANYLYSIAKPDGLTILAVSRANYLEQLAGRPEVQADFRKFGWIGSFNRSPMMVACRSDSPYKTLAAIRSAKISPRFGQSGTGSVSYVFASLVGKIFDLKMKHVSGFQSARETDLGIERGEADCRAATDVVVLRPPWDRWMKDKFITFILQQGPEKSHLVPPVPTVYELAPAEAKPTVDLMSVMMAYTDFERPFAAPPGLPPDRLQILRDSFQRVWHDTEFAAEAKKLTDWDGRWYLSGEQLQKKIETTITQPPDVIKRIREILEES